MTDEFETCLTAALAPAEREPDRPFVARVQAHIALDERLAAARHSVIRRLGLELVGLAAVAAALFWLSRAAPIADLVAESPAAALVALLSIFALVVAAVTAQPGQRVGFATRNRGTSTN